MKLDDVRRFIRQYVNGHGDPAPYDVNGVIHLALAALDNLAERGIKADWEQLADAADEEQKDLLIAIGFWRHVAGSTEQLVSGL